MIFEKALRRDLASLAGIVFSTLFTIMVTTTLIRLLGRASSGTVDTASVLPLIAFASINFLPVILVLTLYISVLMALTRAYRDSEMVIWFASGQSLTSFVRPVLRFAVPFAIAVAVIGFLVAPWANRQASEFQQRFVQREDVSQVAPGQFRESTRADRVFFVENVSEKERTVHNVFVAQLKPQGAGFSVVVSSRGFVDNQPDGQRFLVLEEGRRYDADETAGTYRLSDFERYGVRLEPSRSESTDTSMRVRDTLGLITSGGNRELGELSWRISMPVSALLLALLAIPMSSVNPRVGRSINLVIAVLLYVLYNNLISVTQAWISQGRTSFFVSGWIVHAAMALLILHLFRRRMTLRRWTWRGLLARRTAPATPAAPA